MNDQDEVRTGDLVEPDDGVTHIDGSLAIMALNQSEIDTQITTAKKYPRSIKTFKAQAMELACLDEETAGTMFYVLPRAGKKIEGPSTRLAEVVGSSWGNLRYGSRVVSTDDKFVTAQGACFDLEKNIAITVEVKRRITDKHGKRYNDDMISVASNAAMSIALRNAIFKIVPFAVVKGIYEKARLTSVGKADSIANQRNKMMEWYMKAGATQEQILAFLDRNGIDDITTDDLITMRGLVNTIKEGEATIEQVLGPVPDASKKVNRSNLNEQLGKTSGNGNGHAEKAKPPVELNEQQAAWLDELQEDLACCQTSAEIISRCQKATQFGLPADRIEAYAKAAEAALKKKRPKGQKELV